MSAELPLFTAGADPTAPLAHRMRPTRLEDFLGQEHLLGTGRPLREAIESGRLTSMVFWGPPGCGKTTLARLLANYTDAAFEPFSAVTEGLPRVREIIKLAQQRRATEQRGTILFCDEIHRFNKAQQDAFLPWVEEGVITLIGATTENPSFELTPALLSRLRVFVLQPLESPTIRRLIEQGFAALGLGGADLPLTEDALELLALQASGDARRALNLTEAIAAYLRNSGAASAPPIDAAALAALLERRLPRYDKSGEEHFNLISALHKAVRGSDVEGALYWLARMLEGGEDPLYLARRIVRMAVEDVGLADPRALSVALAAREAFDFLGAPEGHLALAEAVVYLATAAKSNRVYAAWGEAQRAARAHPAEPVPLHIRNAPTRLMRELGYGAGYRYDHDEGGHAEGQTYLPEPLQGAVWYRPTDQGWEHAIAERLARRRRPGRKDPHDS